LKIFAIFILLLITVSTTAQKRNPKSFVLKGHFKGKVVGFNYTNYTGYLYIDYENKKDSCLVVNNNFVFKGVLKKTTCALNLYTNKRQSAINSGFYLENKSLDVELTYEEKANNSDNAEGDNRGYAIFIIKSIKGSEAFKIKEDFKNYFVYGSKQAPNYKETIYKKLNNMIATRPKDEFMGNLLLYLLSRNELDKSELKKIYEKLDTKDLNKEDLENLEKYTYPNKYDIAGNPAFYFELPSQDNTIVSISKYKGKWILLDFWASWCGPCIKSMPELKRIYDLYKHKNFEVIGVSIDTNKQNWLKSITKNQLNWTNLIDITGLDGVIGKTYKLQWVSNKILINPEGKVVSKDIDFDDLEKLLKDL
jgi:peroxiredoxin